MLGLSLPSAPQLSSPLSRPPASVVPCAAPGSSARAGRARRGATRGPCHGRGSVSVRAAAESLQPPHSGYHLDASSPWTSPERRFFEGWYFKLCLPQGCITHEAQLAHPDSAGAPLGPDGGLAGESVAWMYAIEDPLAGGARSEGRYPGVAAQVMGPRNSFLLRKAPDTERFWASTTSLSLGATFALEAGQRVQPRSRVPVQEFKRWVTEGYQVSPTLHQGRLSLDSHAPQSTVEGDLQDIAWCYTTRPLHGWGGRDPALAPDPPGLASQEPHAPLQRAMAGWLAAFPVFEPHWQVCMAGGLSSGWLRLGSHVVHFKDAPSYAEKNWGASFPLKWFWVQCNAFEGFDGRLTVTAGGGRRKVPWGSGEAGTEDVALIGVHLDGVLWEFVPWKGTVTWSVTQWGSWQMKGTTNDGAFHVSLVAETEDPGVVLHAPAAEGGFQPMCRDSFLARLHLRITRGSSSEPEPQDEVLVDAHSSMAAVEVGGGPWWAPWNGSCRSDPVQALLVGAQVDLGRVVPWTLLPPGL